jgi:hypothetical protein
MFVFVSWFPIHCPAIAPTSITFETVIESTLAVVLYSRKILIHEKQFPSFVLIYRETFDISC